MHKYDWRKYEKRLPSAEAFAAMDANAIQRFWSKVEKLSLDECWTWTARTNPNGYGVFRLGAGTHHASRVALALQLGRWPSREEFACHRCDNPPCRNPAHLFIGSSADNIRDAAAKGRTHKWNGARKGENGPKAKLTEHQVREIYALKDKERMKDVCLRFGVSSGAIGAIWRGRSWTHITKPEPTP